MTLGGTITSFIMKISCNFCNLSGFFSRLLNKERDLTPLYLRIIIIMLGGLTLPPSPGGLQKQGSKDANCLFHSRHVMKRIKKKKKIGHMDTLL